MDGDMRETIADGGNETISAASSMEPMIDSIGVL
jgi:hypothetical protein